MMPTLLGIGRMLLTFGFAAICCFLLALAGCLPVVGLTP